MHSTQSNIPCIIFIASMLYISLFGITEGRVAWTCTPCEDEDDCNTDPVEYCMWGEARNYCGRRVCAKGPGERCGGMKDILGKCGAGMWCQHDELDSVSATCHGCYDNSLDCHRDRRYTITQRPCQLNNKLWKGTPSSTQMPNDITCPPNNDDSG